MTRALTGVDSEAVCTKVELFGRTLNSPVMIAPTAFHRLAHDDGEVATARAAAVSGAGYVYSMMLSNTACETVAAEKAESKGAQWAAMYILKDRDYTLHIIRQAEEHGFHALVVTCDHPTERVKTSTMPYFAANENSLIRGVSLSDRMTFPNSAQYRQSKGLSESDSIGDNDGSLTWDDVQWLVQHTHLPVVCKGILSPEDARFAVRSGAMGIIVSNHGCRQMDGTPAAIEMLPAIVAAVRETEKEASPVEILLDSGVRTGSHVLKALALGASAVLIGRPVLWGLACGGEDGVKEVLETLQRELVDDMACVGCRSMADVGPHILHHNPHARPQ